jgi:hypothetical protein
MRNTISVNFGVNLIGSFGVSAGLQVKRKNNKKKEK